MLLIKNFSIGKLHKYGESSTQNNVEKREEEILKTLKSYYKLPKFESIVTFYSITTFFLWVLYWHYYNNHYNSSCITIESKNSHMERMQIISFCTSCVFLIGFFIQIFNWISYSSKNESKYALRSVPIYCTAVIHLIAFLTHFLNHLNWFPYFVSPFGRITCLARWGEWLALVPFLMIMINTVNINKNADENYIIRSTGLQFISIVTGTIANIINSLPISIILMIISLITFMHIYVDVYKSIKAYQASVSSSNSDRQQSQDKDRHEYSVSDVMDSIERENMLIYVNITVVCALTWTIFVLLYGIAILNFIDHTTEHTIFCMIDIVAKFSYARILCSSHDLALNSEKILSKIVFIEEQALASRQQFLRFILHEISTPLNNISMTLDSLALTSPTSIPSLQESEKVFGSFNDYDENIRVAQESCLKINEIFRDVITFQEAEYGRSNLNDASIDLKTIIDQVASFYYYEAKRRQVEFLIEVNSNIPAIVKGDDTKLSQLFSILFSNCISLTNKNGKFRVAVDLDLTSKSFSQNTSNIDSLSSRVKFIVSYTGDKLTPSQESNLFQPYNLTSYGSSSAGVNSFGISLCVAAQIVQLYHGELVFDNQISDPLESRFCFCLEFELPTKTASSDHSENEVDGESKLKDAVKNSMIENGSVISNVSRKSLNYSDTSVSTNSSRLNSRFGSKPNSKLNSLVCSAAVSRTVSRSSSISFSNSASISNLCDFVNESEPPVETSIPKPQKKLTAYVVDDSITNRKLLKKILENFNFEVSTADDGDVLVKNIINDVDGVIQCKYDVIFLDNFMPRLTGVQAIKILREHGYDGVVIGVTGNILKEDILEFLSAGCDEVLGKPVTISILDEILKSFQIYSDSFVDTLNHSMLNIRFIED